MVLEVEIIRSWQDDAGFIVSMLALLATSVFVGLMYKQVKLQHEEKEYIRKLESARFLVEFKRNLVKDHKNLINTISKVVNGNGWLVNNIVSLMINQYECFLMILKCYLLVGMMAH